MIVHTIGHSTLTLDQLAGRLKSHGVDLLIDVRSAPGSRRCRWLGKESLATYMPNRGVGYEHLADLGGFRPFHHESRNTRWTYPAFRGYADWMEGDGFARGLAELERLAASSSVAFMCSELRWTKCHRRMITDALLVRGWDVRHILDDDRWEAARYNRAAIVDDGVLSYRGTGDFTPTFPGF